MCTVLVAWRWRPDVAWLVAANRDELRSRPSDPPLQLTAVPPLWGGRDRLAGGTWLAVDPGGRLCAVTNRHPGGRPPERDATRRSRGELPTRVLATPTDGQAREALADVVPDRYNPVNVLYLSATAALWVGLDDDAGRQQADLSPGIHVLTEQDPDDPSSEKTSRLLDLALAAGAAARDTDDLKQRFCAILRSHDRGPAGRPQDAPCIHEEWFGTLSSALVTSTHDGVTFEHAEGPPCVTAFATVLPRPLGVPLG